jgi:rubredoxin
MRHRKFVCSVCDHVYDEALGDPSAGLAPGTRWEDIPQDWICPDCGATKGDFTPVETEAALS